MSRWVDVLPDKWYYNEMVEASNIYLMDGDPLIESIPYNLFEPNAPFIYKEIKSLAGQKDFILDKAIVPSKGNPLFVYIDGVQTVYENVEPEGGGTKVTMYQAVREGAVVAFASYGKPKVDNHGRPNSTGGVTYPSYTLRKAGSYVHSTNNSQYAEYVYAFGKQLKRVSIPDNEIVSAGGNLQKVLKKYLKYKTDAYYVSSDGIIHMPYNLNNVTCKVTYTSNEGFLKKNTEEFVPVAANILHLNRAFPLAIITRAEGFVLLNRLRMTFYNRFTDTNATSNKLDTEITAYNGQRAVSVQGSYTPGDGSLEVWLNGTPQQVGVDYEEPNNYTIVFKNYLKDGDKVKMKSLKSASSRLKDVGATTTYTRSDTGDSFKVNGTIGNANPEQDSWWAHHIVALEQEILSSGELMISGIPVSADGTNITVNGNMQAPKGDEYWFMPNSFMTRAEATAILNRFRKLCLEKFL